MIGQAGLRIESCPNVLIENILVTGTSGYGIEMLSSQVTLRGATISDNILDGLNYKSDLNLNYCTISYSLFTYNGGYGIYFHNESSNVSVTQESGNRFYLNTAGSMGGNPTSISANPPVEDKDPMYTDKINYLIGTASPLYNTGIGYQRVP